MSLCCTECKRSLDSKEPVTFFACTHVLCDLCSQDKMKFSCQRCNEMIALTPISGRQAIRLNQIFAQLQPVEREEYCLSVERVDSPSMEQEEGPLKKVLKVALVATSIFVLEYLWKRGRKPPLG